MEAVDLTRVFDPEELWPDPEACPDWPLMDSYSRTFSGVGGPDDAAKSLAALEARLGSAGLPAPDKGQAKALIARHFRAGPTWSWRWAALGLEDLRPDPPGSPTVAESIVDAAHLRGYIRKISARAAAEAERGERERLANLRPRLEGLLAAERTDAEVYASLKEAAARHAQRLEDEAAFVRRSAIKHNASFVRSNISRVAADLGVTPPPPPALD